MGQSVPHYYHKRLKDPVYSSMLQIFPLTFTGSFEVAINDKLVYSKLRTMALPDYEEVAQVVSDVAQGGEPREIKGEQPVNCVIS